MRPILSLLLLLVCAPALAGDPNVTKDELSELKGDWKTEKKQHREITAISRRWIAGWQKENQNKMHAADADLIEWRRLVLEELRDAGVSTKDDATDGNPAQQRLRDIVVELRDMQARFDDETAPKALYKRKSELLQSAVGELGDRVTRMEQRYDDHKALYKAQKKAS